MCGQLVIATATTDTPAYHLKNLQQRLTDGL